MGDFTLGKNEHPKSGVKLHHGVRINIHFCIIRIMLKFLYPSGNKQRKSDPVKKGSHFQQIVGKADVFSHTFKMRIFGVFGAFPCIIRTDF